MVLFIKIKHSSASAGGRGNWEGKSAMRAEDRESLGERRGGQARERSLARNYSKHCNWREQKSMERLTNWRGLNHKE